MGWLPNLTKHVGASDRAGDRPATQSGRRGRLSRPAGLRHRRAWVACHSPRLTVDSHVDPASGEATSLADSPPVKTTSTFFYSMIAVPLAHIVGLRPASNFFGGPCKARATPPPE